jgi:O-antigen ligase
MITATPTPLGVWCGWVLAGTAALAPLLAWGGNLGFAPLAALGGLLSLPAARITEEERPAALAILVMVIWAAGSMAWSPFRPGDLEEITALKLVFMAALFWSLRCGAGLASPASRLWASRIFAWGMALLGVILLIEGLTHAELYQALRIAIHDPIRPDLAAKNVAVGAFILAVLWAPATLAAARTASAWLVVPMAAGMVCASIAFGADAPLAALAIGLIAGLAVWFWPMAAPRVLAAGAAVFFLLTPLILWILEQSGLFDRVQAAAPLSWSQRMGYWRHAVGWIADHPLRGWGLDASRMFAPGIQLHPHDAALQIWLELGVIGAVAATVFWVTLFLRLGRARPDAGVAASAAAAVGFLVIAAVSFGVWQEWWLGVGAFAAATCAALSRQPALGEEGVSASLAAQASTIGRFSE